MVCFQPPSLLIGWSGYLCCTFVHVPYTASTLESGQEARIVLIDFSAAFDRVIHQGILYRLCSVGIGSFVLSILTQFGWFLE